ncbi:hypothetical protein N3K66_004716 [Trichothecium roseum]|uniref:Uncharacterized protein n=1 Tax=Trichothecium roseum TaxID=47278 RepID=A0ACC0V3J1_9HYPO|nr:hypothetical protein N3K66_004716 [Trichothecium roseum]
MNFIDTFLGNLRLQEPTHATAYETYNFQPSAKPTGMLAEDFETIKVAPSENAFAGIDDSLLMSRDAQLGDGMMAISGGEILNVLEKIRSLEEQVRKMVPDAALQSLPSDSAPLPEPESEAPVGPGYVEVPPQPNAMPEEPSSLDSTVDEAAAPDTDFKPETPYENSYASLTAASTLTAPSATTNTQPLTETIPIAPGLSSTAGTSTAGTSTAGTSTAGASSPTVSVNFAQMTQGWSNSSTPASASVPTPFSFQSIASAPTPTPTKQLSLSLLHANRTTHHSSLSSGFQTLTRPLR